MADRQRRQQDRQPQRAAQAVAPPGDDDPADERPGTPQRQQRSGGPRARAVLGRRGDPDLGGAEDDPGAQVDDDQNANRRGAQRASAEVRGGGIGSPAARGAVGREGGGAGEHHEPADDEGAARGPQSAEAERERWAGHERHLQQRGLEREQRGKLRRARDDRGQQSTDARFKRRRGEPSASGQHDEQGVGAVGRQQAQADERPRGDRRAHQEDGGLAVPIDQAPQYRRGQSRGDRIGAAGESRDRERAGDPLGVDEDRDAEHCQGQPGHDRAGQQHEAVGARQ